jgi:ribosome recycling factor
VPSQAATTPHQRSKITVISDIIAEAETKMAGAIEYAKEEFAAIRTGRAHPAMFAKITAEYYGAPTPLQQLATFQIPDARVVLITPYDPAAMRGIEKAIRNSDLGVNPSNDGNTIRITLPQLTEERRKEYIKLAKAKAEDARISVRGARRTAKEALDKMVKDKEVGEDEVIRAEKQLDVSTRKHTEEIDEVLKHKEAELLEV